MELYKMLKPDKAEKEWKNKKNKGHIQKRVIQLMLTQRLVHKCSWQFYSELSKTGNNPNVYQYKNGKQMAYS